MSQFERFSVAASDGTELVGYRSGETEGALVLLHGFTVDHTAMLDLAESLLRGTRPVVLVDLRAHGASSLGSEVPDLARLQSDVVEVVNALGLRDVTLVGHSLAPTLRRRFEPIRAPVRSNAASSPYLPCRPPCGTRSSASEPRFSAPRSARGS